jgi:SpoVK/Ycf46/Vps4 family AAA+-type ATPase
MNPELSNISEVGDVYTFTLNNINVSFSAILNTFDGLFSPSNGLIIFITANNPENLDKALIRPGRVDKIIKFDYPRKKEICQAFHSIIGHSQEQFEIFYKKLHNNLSMSSIVDYFFTHPVDYNESIQKLNNYTKLLSELSEKNKHFYK